MNRTSVDHYLKEGCGRCPLGSTPDCKVHHWTAELEWLRAVVLQSELTEEVKWGVPCYTFQGGNVLIVSAFKDYCSINFFKGVLLVKSKGLLEKPGANSQASRVIRFTDLGVMQGMEADIKAAIHEAIEVERAGLKFKFKKNPEPMPEELETRLAEDPTLKSAFEALTPGRQRGYILHFSGAKQSKTRAARIEKCLGKILNGEGMNEKYGRRKK
ncbi:MAG: YdeI/OmpD-associated family protein [Planctomycetota bacterium]|nr:YdeI/OmpD-associated family protein [Planctomycetota bacterium]